MSPETRPILGGWMGFGHEPSAILIWGILIAWYTALWNTELCTPRV